MGCGTAGDQYRQPKWRSTSYILLKLEIFEKGGN